MISHEKRIIFTVHILSRKTTFVDFVSSNLIKLPPDLIAASLFRAGRSFDTLLRSDIRKLIIISKNFPFAFLSQFRQNYWTLKLGDIHNWDK